jgi:hypothetical protein
MFDHTLGRARAAGLPAIFGLATCAHPYSQRTELKHGYRESALELGGSPAAMAQAQLGADHASRRRGANLISSRSLLDAPERGLALPGVYAAELAELAGHLGIVVRDPDADAEPLAVPAEFAPDDEDGTACLRISGETLGGIRELQRLLRGEVAREAAVLYADVDLTIPGDAAVAALRDQGFFLSGLIHAGPGGRDWLRLQRPQAAVEVDALAFAGERGQWLRDRILDDRRAVD